MDEKKGLVFHVIHGSFVDGYGIRTTVFLKGCPLRCRWCCNPEGQKSIVELKFTLELCNGCGKCISACPVDAMRMIKIQGIDRVDIDRSKCTNCLACLDRCFTGALDRFGKFYTLSELFDIVKKDESFYRSSGGGVTIGGGEPIFQREFTAELLKMLKDHYIHTALDTCGYSINREEAKLLEEADLLLYDIKGMASDVHLKNTGVSNKVILDNLRHLDDIGKSIIIRLPLVPGLTDTDDDIYKTAEFLSGCKHVERIDLLAYHEYGKIKYNQLGRDYTLKVPTLSKERLDYIKQILERSKIGIQIGG